MKALLLGVLTASLLGSIHCAAMCGAWVVCGTQGAAGGSGGTRGSGRRASLRQAAYQLGRWRSYFPVDEP